MAHLRQDTLASPSNTSVPLISEVRYRPLQPGDFEQLKVTGQGLSGSRCPAPPSPPPSSASAHPERPWVLSVCVMWKPLPDPRHRSLTPAIHLLLPDPPPCTHRHRPSTADCSPLTMKTASSTKPSTPKTGEHPTPDPPPSPAV